MSLIQNEQTAWRQAREVKAERNREAWKGGQTQDKKRERDSMASRWQGREGHTWKCQQGACDCASDVWRVWLKCLHRWNACEADGVERHAEASTGLEACVACRKKAECAVGGSPATRSLNEKRSMAQGSRKGGPAACGPERALRPWGELQTGRPHGQGRITGIVTPPQPP